jgi:hypothetical protein
VTTVWLDPFVETTAVGPPMPPAPVTRASANEIIRGHLFPFGSGNSLADVGHPNRYSVRPTPTPGAGHSSWSLHMPDRQPESMLREVSPGIWRGELAGYCVQVFEVDGRWVGQAFAGSFGVNYWADFRDEAVQRVRKWIDAHPAKSAHAG